jgi:Flp pilus assembly protein TadD
MLKEADFAFRQAFAVAPSSPEAVFRYINMLVAQKRLEDAVLVAATAVKVEPQDNQFRDLVKELKRFKTSQKN